MAVKKVVQIICDRCEKVVDGDAAAPTPAGDDDFEKKAPLVYVEGTILTEATKIHFTDLCAKCIARVQTLLAQVRLDESAKADDGKGSVGDNAAAASNPKPSTPKEASKVSAKT